MPDADAERPPLNRERVLGAAVDLVDRAGLGALTMRGLGAELGVEAMSLYKHVDNKDAILDGMLELVVGQIDVPAPQTGWKEAMRRRARSARATLRRHSWAIGLLEARGATGPPGLDYLDAILGILRSAGFSTRDAAHAFWLLDSFVYGHVVQETSLPVAAAEGTGVAAPAGGGTTAAERYPHLAELEEHALAAPFSLDDEFEFGLALILDGLERTVGPESERLDEGKGRLVVPSPGAHLDDDGVQGLRDADQR